MITSLKQQTRHLGLENLLLGVLIGGFIIVGMFCAVSHGETTSDHSELTTKEYVSAPSENKIPGIASSNQSTETTPVKHTSSQNQAITTENKTEAGWIIDMPAINLHEKMVEVFLNGNQIPTPDHNVGFLKYSGHIFILGHRSGVFSRLNEIPRQITITIDGNSTTYNLQRYESLPVEKINMHQVMTSAKVSIMTCDGEKIGNSYSKRLILYYK